MAAAALSLLVGPTVCVAFADCCRRQADDKARRTRQKIPAPNGPAKDRQRPPSSEWGSSLLPKASKSDTLKIHTPSGSPAPVWRPHRRPAEISRPSESSATSAHATLHSPAYRQNAPPVRV